MVAESRSHRQNRTGVDWQHEQSLRVKSIKRRTVIRQRAIVNALRLFTRRPGSVFTSITHPNRSEWCKYPCRRMRIYYGETRRHGSWPESSEKRSAAVVSVNTPAGTCSGESGTLSTCQEVDLSFGAKSRAAGFRVRMNTTRTAEFRTRFFKYCLALFQTTTPQYGPL